MALALYVLVGGAVSFVGWPADLPRLTDWDNNGISIQPNTTIAVMLTGAALLLLAANKPRPSAVLGVCVGLIGASTLFQYFTNINLESVNTFFMFGRDWGRLGVVYPGRMGPPGATCLTMLSCALVLGATTGSRQRRSAKAIALATLAIAALSVTGYVYDADVLYSLPNATVIALQTATFIAAASLALIGTVIEHPPMAWLLDRGAAGVIARRSAPLIVLGPFLIGMLRIWGEAAGIYDGRFGIALFVLSLTGLLGAILWRSLSTIAAHDSALRESKRRLTQTLECITDGFITFDRDWRYVFVNEEAARLIHKERAQLLGRSAWELFPEAVDSAAYRELNRAASERVSVQFEDFNPKLQRWFASRAYPTEDGGVAVYFTDVTDRRLAEQALRHADRRKDEFLATLAHELRGPLAPLLNSLEILDRAGADASAARAARETMRRQLGQMVRLVDDLSDVSRIAQDKLELRSERVDIAAVIRQACESCDPLARSREHQLSLTLPDEPILVDGDGARLTQVITNLLNNACKYTEPRGQIWLSAERIGNEAVIKVKDLGMGIPKDKLGSLFEMFSQIGRSSTQTQGGLGIGLHLVRRLVELHGGTVQASSDGPGHGTTFTVSLPISSAQPRVDAPEPLAPPRLPRSRRVLVVDDNVDSAAALALLLRLVGHETHTAHDGLEAVAAAERLRPDLIIMDIGMPKLNGYDACRRIRMQPWGREMTLVALTGWAQEEDRQEAQAAGFDHHLVKPVTSAALHELLGSLPIRRESRV